MPEIILAFITGLTTGGLSCLAVQGGLLASSLAHQIESDVAGSARKQPRLALPIVLFLLAKLTAYTLLGFLLGAFGSMIQLNNTARAALQFAIGIFMIGNALRILNVHPFFRIFSFEPPAFITHLIRKQAKKSDWLTPVTLGVMTVLIPCGITQVMMVAAIGSGSALMGAALLAAFTLGTTPLFFAVSYAAARLGSALEKRFMTAAAVLVLILGLVAIDSGLNLAGSPFSVSGLLASNAAPAQVQTVAEPTAAADPNVLTIEVKNNGYQPNLMHAPANTALKLRLVSSKVYSCSLSFVIPALNIEQMLPNTGEVTLDLPPQAAGTTLRYSCSMGMYTGKIVFDG